MELVLPVDGVVAESVAEDAATHVVPATALPADKAGYDSGPETANLFAERIRTAKTVFWNGPMGRFERTPLRRERKPSPKR